MQAIDNEALKEGIAGISDANIGMTSSNSDLPESSSSLQNTSGNVEEKFIEHRVPDCQSKSSERKTNEKLYGTRSRARNSPAWRATYDGSMEEAYRKYKDYTGVQRKNARKHFDFVADVNLLRKILYGEKPKEVESASREIYAKAIQRYPPRGPAKAKVLLRPLLTLVIRTVAPRIKGNDRFTSSLQIYKNTHRIVTQVITEEIADLIKEPLSFSQGCEALLKRYEDHVMRRSLLLQ